MIPENASISYNNETYYLQQTAPGFFEYTFLQPSNAIDFRLQANKVVSREYTIDVVKTPSMRAFEMFLDYPAYTGKRDEVLKSTGNASIPEGTNVSWRVNTLNTSAVALKTRDTIIEFGISEAEKGSNSEQQYEHSQRVYRKLDYAITTSNENLTF